MDSKVLIDLEVRKDKAAGDLYRFTEEAKQQFAKVQALQAKYDAHPTAFVGNQLKAASLAYGRRIESVQRGQAALDEVQAKIDEESARRGGRLFGIEVNKKTEQFAKQFLGAYIGRELYKVGMAALYTPGGDNTGLRMAEQTGEGAMTGAQIGSVFGPMGTAIGAVTGGLLGLAGAAVELNKEIEKEKFNRSMENYRFDRDSGRELQGTASGYLTGQMTDAARVRYLRNRIGQLGGGKGEWSLQTIKEKLEKMERDKVDPNSANYQSTKEAYSRGLSEIASMRNEMLSAMLKPSVAFQDVGKFADSMQRQGLGTGSAVDVGTVNKGVIDELKLIRKVAERIAGRADENPKSAGAIDTAWNMLGARYSGR